MGDSQPIDYEVPSREHGARRPLRVAEGLFTVAGVLFVPLHLILGPSVLIGGVTAAELAAAAVFASCAMRGRTRREAALMIVASVGGLVAVGSYVWYFRSVLEPLSVLGR